MVENWLHAFPGLQAMGEDGRDRLITSAKLIDILPDQPVFRRCDPCDDCIFVIAGCVRIQISSEAGRELVLYRARSGEICAMNAASLFADSDCAIDGVAETPTRAAAVSAAVFKVLISDFPAMRDFVLREQSRRLIEIIRTLEEITFVRVERRLASILLEFCAWKGEVVRTHQQLAADVGSSREVVCRCLKDFEHRGWVKVGRGAVTLIDRPALVRLSSSLRCSDAVVV